jgi:hypothetical protein
LRAFYESSRTMRVSTLTYLILARFVYFHEQLYTLNNKRSISKNLLDEIHIIFGKVFCHKIVLLQNKKYSYD